MHLANSLSWWSVVKEEVPGAIEQTPNEWGGSWGTFLQSITESSGRMNGIITSSQWERVLQAGNSTLWIDMKYERCCWIYSRQSQNGKSFAWLAKYLILILYSMKSLWKFLIEEWNNQENQLNLLIARLTEQPVLKILLFWALHIELGIKI